MAQEVTTTEIMEFLKGNMVMEQDLAVYTTKQDLAVLETRILNSVDRFAKLHEVLDQELVAMRNRYDRLEGRLQVVEKKVGLAY